MSFLMGSKPLAEQSALRADDVSQTVPVASPSGVAVVRRGVIHFVNDRLCKMLGYSREELAGLNLRDLFADRDDSERLIRDINRQVRESGAGTTEARWRHRDGQTISVQLSASLSDPNGLDTCLNIVVTETVEPGRAQSEADNETVVLGQGHQLFLSGPVVVFKRRNCEGWPVEYVTPNVSEVLGYTADDFMSGRVQYGDIVSEEDRRRVADEVAAAVVGQTSGFVHEPYRVTRNDGRVIWLEDHATILRAADGSVSHYVGYILDVSKARRLEDTARHALAFSRQVVAGIGQGVAVYDRNLHYLEWNPFMERLTGMSKDKVIGNCAFDLFPHLKEHGVDALMCKALAGETVTTSEILFRNPHTGKSHWLINTYSPYRGRSGAIVGIVGLIYDVTDRVSAELALHDTEQLAKAIIHGSPNPQFIIDRDHKVTHWNAALEEISGIKAEEVIGTDHHWRAFYLEPRPCMADILVESTFDTISSWYQGKYRKSTTVAGAYEVIDFFPHLGNGGKWLHFTAAAVRDYEGRIIGAVETLQDITERKRAEEALTASEERYRNFVAHASEGIFRIDFTQPIDVSKPYAQLVEDIDSHAIIAEVNTALAAMYGLQPDDMAERPVRDFAPTCGVQMADLLMTPGCRIVDREESEVNAKGEPIHIVESYYGVVEGGILSRIWGVQRDLTERKKAEEALRFERDRAQHYLDTVETVIIALDAEGRITTVNRKGCQLLGRKEDELLGQSWFSTCLPQPYGMEVVYPIFLQMMAGSLETSEYFENPIVTRSGELRDIAWHNAILRDERGKIIGTLSSGDDVTERKKTEEALRESDTRYRSFIEHSSEGIYRIDIVPPVPTELPYNEIADWINRCAVIMEANEALAAMYGLGRDDMIGRHATEFAPKYGKRAALVLQNKDSHIFDEETIDVGADGTPIWLVESYHGDISDGRLTSIWGVQRNITERKQAEEALRQSESNLATFFNSIDDLVFVTDTEGRILRVNETVLRRLGRKAQDMVGTEYSMLVPQECRDEMVCMLNGMPLCQEAGHSIPILRADGTLIPVETKIVNGQWNSAPALFIVSKDITELKLSEEKFSRSFHMNAALMAISTLEEGRFIDVNDTFLRTLGYSREEVIGRTSAELSLFADQTAREAVVNAVRDHQQMRDTEVMIHRKDKALLTGLFAADVIDIQGVPHLLTVMNDITDRKRTEEKLASIFRSAPIGIGMVKDCLIVEANDEVCRMTGYSRDDLLGHDARMLYPTHEEYDYVDREKNRQISETGTGTVETRWQRKDGSIIHIVLSLSPLDRSDESRGVTLTALDVTDRKRAEEAVREKAEELDRYFTNALDLLCIADTDGRFRRLNKEWEHVLGYPIAELEGARFLDLVHPDDQEATRTVVSQLSAQEEVACFVNRYRCKDGSYRWIEWRSFPSGNLIYACASDITLRRQAEEALVESEHRFRIVGEQTGHMVYDWDMATGEIKWIGSVETITDFKAEEYQDVNITKWEQMVHPDDRHATITELNGVAQSGSKYQVEYRLQRKDGSYVFVEDSGVFLKNDRGEPCRKVGTMKDISERKQAQEDREHLIRELEGKNAELARFAYTVSHDLKAPLITISGFVGLLRQHAGAGAIDRMNADMDRICNAASKMGELLDSLLEMSRIGRIENPSETIQMTDLALEAAEMLAGRISDRGVEVKVASGLPAVVGDRPRLLEVLQNLIDNAVKYMGSQTAPLIEINCEQRSAETLFHVRDNGIGILPRFHERVFDLFTQLEPSVEGSGVGLALAKRIVEYHGGRIWVESEGMDRGSTFYFTLPGRLAEEPSARRTDVSETVSHPVS